jgi:lactate dehydrogenase-like 2-hydroxyacid dehydrogenase
MRLGIYGLGTIGLKIARRAEAFEMEVAYHGRRDRPGCAYRYVPTLLGLATWADALVVSVRAGPGNRHAVDAAVLDALGPGGHLVNVARGSLLDEPALIEALRAGRLGGAGLDVFAREPAVPPGLVASDRVVLTPHLGGSTTDAHARMGDLLLANIRAFLDGRPLPSPVPGPSAG